MLLLHVQYLVHVTTFPTRQIDRCCQLPGTFACLTVLGSMHHTFLWDYPVTLYISLGYCGVIKPFLPSLYLYVMHMRLCTRFLLPFHTASSGKLGGGLRMRPTLNWFHECPLHKTAFLTATCTSLVWQSTGKVAMDVNSIVLAATLQIRSGWLHGASWSIQAPPPCNRPPQNFGA